MPSPPRRLDLGKLGVFLEATRSGNYTTAARRLNVTQSAVSHAIRKLEEALGQTLVEWRHRRFSLTDQGDYLHRVCQRVFQELGEAEEALTRRAPALPQVLTIGATAEFGSTVLVRKLRPLLDEAPWLHVNFRLRDDLGPSLLRDEVDAAVDCRQHVDPSIQATGLFREKYLLVASPSFLAAHRLDRPIDLERVPVLSLDSSGVWWANALRALPGRQRPVLGHIVEVDQIRGMVHAALEGYGVALLPKYAVLGKVARGELVALFPRLPLVEDWFCLYQKRAYAAREKNRLLSDYLLRLNMTEFGDAIEGPSRPGTRAKRLAASAARPDR